MAQNDIYNSEDKWNNWVEKFIKNKKILEAPKPNGKRKYYCRFKGNFKYYEKMIRNFEVDDLSYIRRSRMRDVMNFLCFFIPIDLKDINGLEKDNIIIQLRKTTTPNNLKRTEGEIKRLGRILFEEEETRPKFFKELKIKTDISRQSARKDKMVYEEIESIIKFFSNDVVMKAYVSIAFETLARPQELCYIKIKNIQLFDNYAQISITEHGKEGIKKLLCIDSFPYLLSLYNTRKDPEAYLFYNSYGEQLTPQTTNSKLKTACKVLKIDKPISPYSLKRAGVTIKRQMGFSDFEIQHIAGWRSGKMLKTYDLSSQDDVFKLQLAKRGLIKDEKFKQYLPKTKNCPICNEIVGFAETTCPKCMHIMDRNLIKDRIEKDKELIDFFEGIKELKQSNPDVFEIIKEVGRKKGIIPYQI